MGEYSLHRTLSALPDYQRFPRRQLADFPGIHIENSLEDRPLTGQGDYLIIPIIECRTYPPRIPDREHLAAPGQSAHHIASVEFVKRGAEDVLYLDIVVNKPCDLQTFFPGLLGLHVVPLDLPVQAVSHQFKSDVSVAVDAGGLPLADHILENLIDISHVEVAAQAEVPGSPVVPAQERVHV